MSERQRCLYGYSWRRWYESRYYKGGKERGGLELRQGRPNVGSLTQIQGVFPTPSLLILCHDLTYDAWAHFSKHQKYESSRTTKQYFVL